MSLKTKKPRRFSWNRLLWWLIWAPREQRIVPTLPGVFLIALSFAIGGAAYNTANNILFITLALLLSCLILSGVLSWLNFSELTWTLKIKAPLRSGHLATVTVEFRNAKKLLPTYGLWLDFSSRYDAGKSGPETTFTADAATLRAAWKQADLREVKDRITLQGRFDPGAAQSLEWTFTPPRRGRITVSLQEVGSLFPFGFLRKSIPGDERQDAFVWPASVEYQMLKPVALAQRQFAGRELTKVGSGSDLLALRPYQTGDSHRLVHWKASARLGKLMVRQFAAESSSGFFLWIQTSSDTWTRPEQFEVLCSFAATLAEDLFTQEKLTTVKVNNDDAWPVRDLRDVETLFDRLSVVVPVEFLPQRIRATGDAIITFEPNGARGVYACINGEKAASA